MYNEPKNSQTWILEEFLEDTAAELGCIDFFVRGTKCGKITVFAERILSDFSLSSVNNK